MRSILTISLPEERVAQVKERAKRFGFSGVSEYVRHLIAQDDHLISKKELLASIKRADADYKNGRVKVLKSLRDLM